MSLGSYSTTGLALFFATAVGVAVGAKLIMDESKRAKEKAIEEKPTAKILQFKPRG